MWVADFHGGSCDFGIKVKDWKEFPNRNTLQGQVPSRLAVDVLKDFMRKFETLEWIPGGMHSKGNPQQEDESGSDREWSDYEDEEVEEIKKNALTNNIQLGNGYGKWGRNTFRIANFPAIPDADFNQLKDFFIRNYS